MNNKSMHSIPENTMYCGGMNYLCPHWKLIKNEYMAYCSYLESFSEWYDSNNLIWDQCKECNVGLESEDENPSS